MENKQMLKMLIFTIPLLFFNSDPDHSASSNVSTKKTSRRRAEQIMLRVQEEKPSDGGDKRREHWTSLTK